MSEVTGFPEMLDGRVKTLHPRVHGGILARRDKPDHLASLAEHGIPLIDLVVVNLYPFAKAAADPGDDGSGLIEQIDIGGPGMVRAAAKNFRDVLVLVDPADYPRVLEALAGGAAAVPQALRFELARKAFAHTGAYDQMIAVELAHVTMADDGGTRIPAAEREPFPELVTRTPLAHPRPALRREPAPARGLVRGRPDRVRQRAPIHQGKELSFTNLLDLDAAARIVLEFTEPAASVIKHTNPCGVATGADAADAYVRAREADPLSAFGGIIGLNRTLDAATAEAIVSTFIEAVVAPDVDDAARADPGQEGQPARRRPPTSRRWRRRRRSSGDRSSARHWCSSAIASIEARAPWGADERAQGRHEAAADRRRVAGAALRVARLRAREVQHHPVCLGRPHARRRRRSDEPRRLGEGRDHEGGRGQPARLGRRPRTRSSRSATGSTPSPRPAPRRSCSRAARCATRK